MFIRLIFKNRKQKKPKNYTELTNGMYFISLTANFKYEGLNLVPSRRRAEGTSRINEMMVITENKLMLSSACSKTPNN